MKTITLTLALGAALALSAALPAAAAGNNGGGLGIEGHMNQETCEALGGVWSHTPAGAMCEYDDGITLCDHLGFGCTWHPRNPSNRNVNRGPQAPATAGVATAPQSPRRGFQIQPMFPAVGTFRIR